MAEKVAECNVGEVPGETENRRGGETAGLGLICSGLLRFTPVYSGLAGIGPVARFELGCARKWQKSKLAGGGTARGRKVARWLGLLWIGLEHLSSDIEVGVERIGVVLLSERPRGATRRVPGKDLGAVPFGAVLMRCVIMRNKVARRLAWGIGANGIITIQSFELRGLSSEGRLIWNEPRVEGRGSFPGGGFWFPFLLSSLPLLALDCHDEHNGPGKADHRPDTNTNHNAELLVRTDGA